MRINLQDKAMQFNDGHITTDDITASSVVSVTLLYIVESDSAAILQSIQSKSSVTGPLFLNFHPASIRHIEFMLVYRF